MELCRLNYLSASRTLSRGSVFDAQLFRDPLATGLMDGALPAGLSVRFADSISGFRLRRAIISRTARRGYHGWRSAGWLICPLRGLYLGVPSSTRNYFANRSTRVSWMALCRLNYLSASRTLSRGSVFDANYFADCSTRILGGLDKSLLRSFGNGVGVRFFLRAGTFAGAGAL